MEQVVGLNTIIYSGHKYVNGENKLKYSAGTKTWTMLADIDKKIRKYCAQHL